MRSLEDQKEEFKRAKLLATPIAGMIAWFIVAHFEHINRLYKYSFTTNPMRG